LPAPVPSPESPFLPDSSRIVAAYHLLFGEQRARRWRNGAAHPKSKVLSPPGSGVMRHADAGYELAVQTAQHHGIDLPMIS